MYFSRRYKASKGSQPNWLGFENGGNFSADPSRRGVLHLQAVCCVYVVWLRNAVLKPPFNCRVHFAASFATVVCVCVIFQLPRPLHTTQLAKERTVPPTARAKYMFREQPLPPLPYEAEEDVKELHRIYDTEHIYENVDFRDTPMPCRLYTRRQYTINPKDIPSGWMSRSAAPEDRVDPIYANIPAHTLVCALPNVSLFTSYDVLHLCVWWWVMRYFVHFAHLRTNSINLCARTYLYEECHCIFSFCQSHTKDHLAKMTSLRPLELMLSTCTCYHLPSTCTGRDHCHRFQCVVKMSTWKTHKGPQTPGLQQEKNKNLFMKTLQLTYWYAMILGGPQSCFLSQTKHSHIFVCVLQVEPHPIGRQLINEQVSQPPPEHIKRRPLPRVPDVKDKLRNLYESEVCHPPGARVPIYESTVQLHSRFSTSQEYHHGLSLLRITSKVPQLTSLTRGK